MQDIKCVGPGPHAPADGILARIPDGQPTFRVRCAACVKRPTTP